MTARAGGTALLAALALAACSDEPPQWSGARAVPQPAPPPAAQAQPSPPPAADPRPAEAPKPDPDKDLAARVKKALEGAARDQAGEIDVSAAEGVISLWGTVATAGERTRAARIAAGVEGVRSVENRLAVVKGS